jgi:dTDP-4-dehydrorhamnose 3,5-epimerase
MVIKSTDIEGLYVITYKVNRDARGVFSRLFCENELEYLLKDKSFVQTNYSLTKEVGTVRGMHFQYPPFAETKLVTCLSGAVYDVVVDLRKNSPTFLEWRAFELSPEIGVALFIPEGFAHGFQVIKKEAILLYQHTEFYQLGHEGGINCFDSTLNIEWPLLPKNLSDRDKNHPEITDDFGIKF